MANYNSTTLVLGIGNILLSDEGAGIHALSYFEKHFAHLHPECILLDGGTLSFTLAADIENASRLIVFDAAQLKDQAGTVRCMEGEAMDSFLAKGGRSVHEVGLMDLMDIARLVERLPLKRALVGVQPLVLTWGEEVSEALKPAIPVAAELAHSLIQQWESNNNQGT